MNYDLLWCFGRNSELLHDYGVSFNLAIEWEESLGEVCGDGSLRCLVPLGFSQTLVLCVLPVSDSVMNENPKTPLRLVLEVSKKKSKCNFSELQGVPCYGCNVPFDVSDSSCIPNICSCMRYDHRTSLLGIKTYEFSMSLLHCRITKAAWAGCCPFKLLRSKSNTYGVV